MAAPETILSPFRAIRYQTSEKHDLSHLLAPPYDVVSEAMQAELLARHAHNFIRVELPGDGEGRYEAAAAALRDWLAAGVLKRDSRPAFYLLEQQFRAGGRTLRRRGVFGLVRLPEADEAYVLPHEGTLAAPKADRLRLMRACQAMTSPILVIHEDEDQELIGLMTGVAREPDATAKDSAGAIHRVWRLRDPKTAEAICAAVGPGPLFIADGHHRFETAIAYREEMRQLNPNAAPDAGFNYALALVTSAQDEGLEIFPTHRLVSCPGEEAQQRVSSLMREYFEVHEWPLPDPAALGRQPWLEGVAPDRHVFGAYCGNGKYYVLIARDDVLPGHRSVVDHLDVSVLHQYLVDPILAGSGLAPDADGRVSHDSASMVLDCPGARLMYVTDERQAIAAVERGDYQFSFFLRPTRVADVMAAARAGERMPGKSTYFYPKVPAGIVISDASAEPL
jgi:uncharacterized protein (DUF1015 family)